MVSVVQRFRYISIKIATGLKKWGYALLETLERVKQNTMIQIPAEYEESGEQADIKCFGIHKEERMKITKVHQRSVLMAWTYPASHQLQLQFWYA